MNFFKTVFSDDPEPEPESDSPKTQHDDPDPNSPPPTNQPDPNPNPNPNPSSVWTFGGLIKTLSAKSESVIETYRRDLHEFGSGLKKEIEVAQGSIGTVSHAIDEFGNSVIKGTAQIISQGKDAILAVDHESSDSSSDTNNNNNSNSNNNNDRNYQQNLSSKRYSRFDAQVRVIQGDVNTYCEEVEDLEDYKKWKLGFVLEREEEEIEGLFEESNGVMESIYKKVVPSVVDHDTFWCRYFYKVYRLKQAEEVRATLVKRAISTEEDEVLSWDVDEEDEGEGERNVVSKADFKGNENVGSEDFGEIVKDDDDDNEKLSNKEVVGEKGEKVADVENGGKGSVVESSGENSDNEKGKLEKNVEMSKEDDEKEGGLEGGKVETGESSKDSDFSVVSSQPSMPEEEDLGWDEIEDLSSIDEKSEKKVVTHGGSPNRSGDLRKRLSTAEEEEDLSWDIEDDDEPVKA